MSQFVSLVARFGRDERGVFAVIFGLMAIVLIALSGAVVDYVSIEQMRNRAQIALDASALALQPDIFETPLNLNSIKQRAQALVQDRLGDDFEGTATLLDPIADVDDGTLTLQAEMTMPTIFVSLVGVPTLKAHILSQATRKKLALEVAMVLDNSGSMSYYGAGSNGSRQRIQFLKDAANCATNTLFYDAVVTDNSNPDTCVAAPGAKKVENVRMGVIPFNMFVNVGPSNANANWIDKTGASVIANDNFDDDDDESTFPTHLPNRSSLFSRTNVNWRGCVEARPHIKTGSTADEYLDTDDTAPTGGNSLFVPLFSPDMVDGVGNNHYLADAPAVCDRPAQGSTKCTITEERTADWWGRWSGGQQIAGTPSGPINFSSNALYNGAYYGRQPDSCSCRNGITYTSNWTDNGYKRQTRQGYCSSFIPTGLTQRELQERVCKYNQTATDSFSTGPNADCVRTAVLPLTNAPTTVTTAINSMQAEGGTNIHQGTAWGYRVLSPGQPFTEGASYNTSTSKVMIIMTDGENTAYNLSDYCGSTQRNLNGSCYNSAYGFPYNSQNNVSGSSSSGNVDRLGKLGAPNADLVKEMNRRTSQTCENAKNAGIAIYTIGLATDQAQQSTQAEVEKMLTDCASTSTNAYFPKTPGELRAVFASIANELSALRLSQ